jgi:hypothetical protein
MLGDTVDLVLDVVVGLEAALVRREVGRGSEVGGHGEWVGVVAQTLAGSFVLRADRSFNSGSARMVCRRFSHVASSILYIVNIMHRPALAPT